MNEINVFIYLLNLYLYSILWKLSKRLCDLKYHRNDMNIYNNPFVIAFMTKHLSSITKEANLFLKLIEIGDHSEAFEEECVNYLNY